MLDLSTPKIMGVLNLTPDSFSDGGQYRNRDEAIQKGLLMQEQGAAIIDLGGESTRPGANPVSTDEELGRVLPVLEGLVKLLDVPVSIDTSNPEVMLRAVEAGAGFINDVRAFNKPDALRVAAQLAVPICLMHMQGEPPTMQTAPNYADTVREVADYLRQRAAECCSLGIKKERIIIDPGFGFGKTVEHNLALFAGLQQICSLGFPVLVGVSRKSMIGALTGAAVDKRLGGGIALATLAVRQGAKLIRTHDVFETAQALTLVAALDQF